MRVFVFGTGRCGTVAVANAFHYASNYSVSHERFAASLKYPDQHIAVNAQLRARMPELVSLYPDAWYIWLRRDIGKVTKSYRRLANGQWLDRWWAFYSTVRPDDQNVGARIAAANLLSECQRAWDVCPQSQRLAWDIDCIKDNFAWLWKHLDLQGDLESALRSFNVPVNTTKQRQRSNYRPTKHERLDPTISFGQRVASESVTEYSLRTWKERHEQGYFPRSEQHGNWKLYEEFYPPFQASVRFGGVALEIGCGYGEWMVALANQVTYVTGVDIHESLVTKAEELFKCHEIYNASVIKTDGLTLPFGDDSFSFVYSISTFQHLPRSIVAGYLAEAFRVLSAGGTVAFHFRSSRNWQQANLPQPAKDIEINHTGDFSVGWSRREVKHACSAAGFAGRVTSSEDGLFWHFIGHKI